MGGGTGKEEIKVDMSAQKLGVHPRCAHSAFFHCFDNKNAISLVGREGPGEGADRFLSCDKRSSKSAQPLGQSAQTLIKH